MDKHPLYVRTRERILQILYDGNEKSAYEIAKEVDIATATAVEHLMELVSEGMVVVTPANMGKRYKITKAGKKSLKEFEKKMFIKLPDEIKKLLASIY